MRISRKVVRSARAGERPAPVVVVERLELRRLLSADLSPVFGALPETLAAEGKSKIAVRVVNTGDAPAKGKAAIQLYASLDGTLDDSDVLLGTVGKKLNLKPGKSSSVKLSVPAGELGGGSYTLIASLTPPANAGDANTGNDVVASSSSVAVPERVVDLAVAQVGDPQLTGQHGQTVTATVVNQGTVAATGGVAVDWFLSADTTLDANDVLIASAPSRNVRIARGKGQVFRAAADVPSTTPLGTYHLIARVTAAAELHDNNPANDVGVADQTLELVDPPPRQRGYGWSYAIVTEAYYQDYYVVDEGVTVDQPSDTGVTGGDPGSGYAPGEPPAAEDPPAQQDPPESEPPANDPPPTYDPPPANEPPPVSEPPVVAPVPEPEPAPPVSNEGYTSSGGDF